LWEDNYIVTANGEVHVRIKCNRYDPVMSLTERHSVHVCKLGNTATYFKRNSICLDSKGSSRFSFPFAFVVAIVVVLYIKFVLICAALYSVHVNVSYFVYIVVKHSAFLVWL
jgi:hypothetical protein